MDETSPFKVWAAGEFGHSPLKPGSAPKGSGDWPPSTGTNLP
jgi:hypothetical protein